MRRAYCRTTIFDHAKSAKEIQDYGVRLYCSKGTADALGVDYYQLEEGKEEEIGSFKIIPFDVQHDCLDPFGFLIRSGNDGESMVFATDTFYLRNRFPAVTTMAIECNYAHDLIGDCPYQDRLFQSHMSLKQCLETLKANDLSKCREIHLLHLSDNHGDEDRFIREVQEAFGIPTFAAPKRLKV